MRRPCQGPAVGIAAEDLHVQRQAFLTKHLRTGHLGGRDDGRGLWYRANVNWLHGASGEGKTWVALIAVARKILTIANAIGGTGSVTQGGTGTTTLSGINTYSGGTTVASGTLVGANGSALGTDSGLSVSGTGTFNYRPGAPGALALGSGVINLSNGSRIGAAVGGMAGPPKRARGGPVQKDRAYWVGEEKPEVFVPRQSGNVVPLRKPTPMSGGRAKKTATRSGERKANCLGTNSPTTMAK